MIKLTPLQKKHLSAIRWLISDGNLGTGRSSLLAYCFIEKAISQMGQPVRIFDHTGLYYPDIFHTMIVQVVTNAPPDVGITYYENGRYIVANPREQEKQKT